MDSFGFYIQLGFEHISDFAGYDHMLFLVALCAIYRIQQWKSILVLVTAFTIGHSITLALSSLDIVTIPSNIIEFLIPVTIFLTALNNVIGSNPADDNTKMRKNYAMALFFGFIHGMGFSNYFKALLMDSSSVALPLLGFNIGIELGQILVVFFIVGIAYLFLNKLAVKHRDWNVFISGAATGMSLIFILENKIW
ncbi:HupE/UreJ family protein [Aquimarina litoralis]|uniref:HupE/UreJ family protein n=1 Tax=Aquimarina litoralis TaxID=584605 RepID=UPI001C5891D7|nr:HupE/UreJ family protein [Aquimarina litoralis]MBW1295004.1 HupE/UreJ family protein [Aquimarina litoralis]